MNSLFHFDFTSKISSNWENIFYDPKFTLLLFLIVVWIAGIISEKIGFPSILGEILSGLILGPPVLGFIKTNTHIEWLASLGVLFMMFLTGLKINPTDMKTNTKSSMKVAFWGTIIPFVLGFFIVILFKRTIQEALFVGMGLSVTSIATKGKLLVDLKIIHKKVSTLMVNAAIYDNIFSLVLFSVIVSVIKLGVINITSVIVSMLEVVLFFMFLFLSEKYLLNSIKKLLTSTKTYNITLLLIVVIIYGLVAEFFGIHKLVGFFFAGLHLQRKFHKLPVLNEKLINIVSFLAFGFLGPLFFITLSFHIDFSEFKDTSILFASSLILVAIVGKILGAFTGAKLSGFNLRNSLLVGFGMNGRGMTEIIMILIGIELKVLSDSIASVFLALVVISNLVIPLFLKILAKDSSKII